MSATTTLLRRIGRLEGRLPSREPDRREMLYRAAKQMSDGELRMILSARKNETDQLTDAQAKAMARLRALAEEERAKWAANESKPTQTVGRGAADDDGDLAWRTHQNRLRS
jgi:hypothetical protein